MNWMKSRSLALAAAALAAFVPLASTMGCNKPQVEQAKGEAATAPAAAPAARALSGAETPELLVARMKAGAAKEDLGEIAACLTPKNRSEMAMAMYMGATMMVAFAEMGAEMGGAMAEGMAGMGGEMSAEDKAKAEEQKAKAKEGIAGMKTAYNNLITKYGLPARRPSFTFPACSRAKSAAESGVSARWTAWICGSRRGKCRHSSAPTAPVRRRRCGCCWG